MAVFGDDGNDLLIGSAAADNLEGGAGDDTFIGGAGMTEYQLWDATRDPASGHFVVGGVTQGAGTVIDISAAQLSQTTFVTGTLGTVDALQIRAFDGITWSAGDTSSWSPFHIAVS